MRWIYLERMVGWADQKKIKARFKPGLKQRRSLLRLNPNLHCVVRECCPTPIHAWRLVESASNKR